MQHIIKIKMQCPLCGILNIISVQKNYEKTQCYVCSEINSGVYLEPIEIQQQVFTPFDDWKEGKDPLYVPTHPLYYHERLDEHCHDDCNKCNGCEYLVKDEYDIDDCSAFECIGNNCESCNTNLYHLRFLEKHHFSEQETYSFDSSIARFIVPRLKYWIEKGTCGHPTEISEEEWNIILKKILFSMTEIAYDCCVMEPKKYEKIQEGCELLGKWFTGLWD